MTYPAFYDTYIKLVKEKPLLTIIKESKDEAIAFYENLPPEKWQYSYAGNKWSIKEILGHITETERIMSYRALRFARRDKTPLPGFEQDNYVNNANYNRRQPDDLINEFSLLRQANILLFTSFSAEGLQHTGVVDKEEISVEALGYIIAGHELHHRQVIINKYLD
ncbi:MAG: DinB family protein [Cyclobacteriaceae bacterium]